MVALIVFIQSVYDFIGWFVILKEKHGHWRDYGWREWTYRAIQFTLDFPATIYIVWDFQTLLAIYVMKWLGVCDLLYLIYKWFFTKSFFRNAEWFWWMPLSLIQRFTGGYIYTTRAEFLIQCAIGIILGIIILII